MKLSAKHNKNCRLQLLCVLNISNVALPPPEWTLVYRCWWGVHVFASLPHVVGLQAGWSQLSPARVLQVMWQQHSRRVSHRHHWHQGQLQTGQVRPEQAKHFIINAEAEPLNPQTKKTTFWWWTKCFRDLFCSGEEIECLSTIEIK